MIKTHCNGSCKLDKNRNYCLGCLRTVNELKLWHSLSENEQNKILEEYNKQHETI